MAQVGCRHSVACLSFRSMADLGYYYSPMEGDHLTTTGHTGVPAGFQLDNSFVSIDKKAKVSVSIKMSQQNLKLFKKSCLNATRLP
ncbi:hypothetical protein T11_17014 [Trichinella zimbabwensis]|uniref:Uncharacterized protein n=1 Tax=Trichinella zimbabwensis TaxID=268475 RepID=A0A0V1HC65_9BILA|nr:hypothetical protein T11_17014 [Trichinella zimbabwensis]